jgi:enoyl-CoA hydratase
LLLFTGDRIGAEEARSIGLVDVVAPAGEALSQSLALAERIARNAPLAVSAAKRAVNLGLQMSVVDGHRLEATLFAALAQTRDFDEGVRAFLEKREPRFTRE